MVYRQRRGLQGAFGPPHRKAPPDALRRYVGSSDAHRELRLLLKKVWLSELCGVAWNGSDQALEAAYQKEKSAFNRRQQEPSDRPRDEGHAEEYFGRLIDVPWSGWPGYSTSPDYITGMVFDYGPHIGRTDSARFKVCFPRVLARGAQADDPYVR